MLKLLINLLRKILPRLGLELRPLVIPYERPKSLDHRGLRTEELFYKILHGV